MNRSITFLSTIAVAAQAVDLEWHKEYQAGKSLCWTKYPTGCDDPRGIYDALEYYRMSDKERGDRGWIILPKQINDDKWYPAEWAAYSSCRETYKVEKNKLCKRNDIEFHYGPTQPSALNIVAFTAALESVETWSAFASHNASAGLKEFEDKRETAVFHYFEKKDEQATDATALIAANSDAITKAAAAKTAKASQATAKTAYNAADANKTAAYNKMMDFFKSGKAQTEHVKGMNLTMAYSATVGPHDTDLATLEAADTAYGAAKESSDAAATAAATAKTTASAAVSAATTARAAAFDAHKAFADGVDAHHKAGEYAH